MNPLDQALEALKAIGSALSGRIFDADDPILKTAELGKNALVLLEAQKAEGDVEGLARFLNQISQTDIHFDSASQKIQDVYRNKARWILEWLGPRRLTERSEATRVVSREEIDTRLRSHFGAPDDTYEWEGQFTFNGLVDAIHALQLPQPVSDGEIEASRLYTEDDLRQALAFTIKTGDIGAVDDYIATLKESRS